MLGKHSGETEDDEVGTQKRHRLNPEDDTRGRDWADQDEDIALLQRRQQHRSGVNCLRARDKILAVERDYQHFFIIDVNGEEGVDQFVYQHFNNLCLVGLAPSHAALAGGRKIVKVDFDVGRSGDKNTVKLSGKKKSGALYLVEESRLCDIVCQDGSKYKVRSCIRGHLLELNERLREEPWLLNDKSATEGYIAIIRPKREDEAKIGSSLLSEEMYMKSRGQAAAGGPTV